MLSAERAIQSDLYNTVFAALSIQEVDRFFDGLADGTHCNDHMLCIRCAVVIEQTIVGADLLIDFIHVLFHNCRKSFVILVACLTDLEEDIRVLRAAPLAASLRVERRCLELLNRFQID